MLYLCKRRLRGSDNFQLFGWHRVSSFIATKSHILYLTNTQWGNFPNSGITEDMYCKYISQKCISDTCIIRYSYIHAGSKHEAHNKCQPFLVQSQHFTNTCHFQWRRGLYNIIYTFILQVTIHAEQKRTSRQQCEACTAVWYIQCSGNDDSLASTNSSCIPGLL